MSISTPNPKSETHKSNRAKENSISIKPAVAEDDHFE